MEFTRIIVVVSKLIASTLFEVNIVILLLVQVSFWGVEFLETLELNMKGILGPN